eukprot:CAMPEP_0185251500 /NCGR_PEP_ID=MMETSP1359-20130426/889_1 /TAXON_ID=552665 /ORGANISM="Bigelowiella longifila, Strain CCMP242" /LENGTH=195 /DNA_ID=CAMNT_0027833417 /DNA_START=24 /DNA_END=608 /DNA_ORIENTATION=-
MTQARMAFALLSSLLFASESIQAIKLMNKTIPFEYPLFKQCDPTWGSDLMVTTTICKVGCLMSSTSMALNGSGIQINATSSGLEAVVSTNPGSLNKWLQANGGYDGQNDMYEEVIPKIDSSRIKWASDAMHKTNDLPFEKIQEYVSRPRIVIANVLKGRHFVLVTGWGDDGDTLYVHDPGFEVETYSHSKDVVGW